MEAFGESLTNVFTTLFGRNMPTVVTESPHSTASLGPRGSLLRCPPGGTGKSPCAQAAGKQGLHEPSPGSPRACRYIRHVWGCGAASSLPLGCSSWRKIPSLLPRRRRISPARVQALTWAWQPRISLSALCPFRRRRFPLKCCSHQGEAPVLFPDWPAFPLPPVAMVPSRVTSSPCTSRRRSPWIPHSETVLHRGMSCTHCISAQDTPQPVAGGCWQRQGLPCKSTELTS